MSINLYLISILGRDDFNFSSWILLASSHIAPVTERNTLDFNGYGVGGLLYPPRALPMWQNSFQRVQKQVFGFLLLISDLMLAIFIQTSSVTKRNIMGGMGKVVDKAYTPHQCAYGDRKNPYWEKSPNNKNMSVWVIIWWILIRV